MTDKPEEPKEILGTATYDPSDDKLRFYAFHRLDPEIYAKFKKLGFGYAPRQGWIGQVWTPEREDLVLQYSDNIDDEDKTLAERTEERSERFTQYADHAHNNAEAAQGRVHAIADNIPFGQPILVGHHSERHARADQERIFNGMHKAVNEWNRAEYWKDRATRTLRHAAYKELPAVRFRKIKTLKSDLRKHQKEQKRYDPNSAEGQGNIDWLDWEAKNEKHLTDPSEIKAWKNKVIENSAVHHQRWIDHLLNRIAYEMALYEGNEIPSQKTGTPIEKGGQVLCGSYITHIRMWFEVLKVNKDREGNVNSVTIPSTVTWRKHWIVKTDIIKGIRSKEMIAAGTFPDDCTDILIFPTPAE
jgi:hypothetical protein